MAGGILLCMIALARPQWGQSEQRAFRKGRDIVIALDVSRSMLANDVYPNRLERAKIDIMDLMNDIEGDRTALLAFRRKAVALCPLTTDYAFLRHILDMSGLHSAPVGETDIGDAIDKAVEMLIEDDSSHKAILLISDGEDLTGRAMDAAKKAATRGIPIFTVGFGRASGSTIPDAETGSALKYKGKEVISRLNNDTLYKIAKTTGGAYIPIQTASTAETTLGNIYQDHFSKIAARELEETITSSYAERFHYFLLPGILLLLSACFFSKGRLTGYHRRKAAPTESTPPPIPELKNMNPEKPALKRLVIVLALLTPCLCLAATNLSDRAVASLPEGRAAAREAQRLYSRGQFAEAAELYLRAAATISGPAKETFTYNAATSLYKQGKHSEAADLLDTISGEGAIPLDRLDMALGSAHFQSVDSISDTNEVSRLKSVAQALESSAEHFAEASRLKTGSYSDAMRNTAAALEKLPAARQEAHEQGLLDAHSSSDAFKLLDQILTDQREIISSAAEAYMIDDPSQIHLLEELAKKQEANADLWIPLRTKLNNAAAASTNKVSTAALERMADDLSLTMKQSARSMKDLDTSGYHKSAMAEEGVYRLWKSAAPFSKLLSEDLRRQSNSVSKATSRKEKIREQEEASELTDLFAQRFKQAYPKDAPPPKQGEEDENALTPEDRQKIIELADAAKSMQEQALQALASDNDIAALDRHKTANGKLQDIQKLLPKQKKKSQQQQDPKQKKEDQQKNEDQEEKNDPPPDQQADSQNQEQNDEKDPKEAEPDEKQDASDADVERLLEKALQREKEHETEKRRRHEYTPPSMIERDW